MSCSSPSASSEVADEHLVDERRQQVGGVELAEPGLARDAFGEAVDRRDRTVVDGDDQVPAGQEVDLAADEAAVVVGLQRLEDEVDPVGLAAQLGPALGLARSAPCPRRGSPASRASASRSSVARRSRSIQRSWSPLQAGDRSPGRSRCRGPGRAASNSRPLMVLSGRREQERARRPPSGRRRIGGRACARSERTGIGAADGSSMVWVVMRCASLSTWAVWVPGARIVRRAVRSRPACPRRHGISRAHRRDAR